MSYLSQSKKHGKKKTDNAVVKMQETLHEKVNPASASQASVPRPSFGRRSGTR